MRGRNTTILAAINSSNVIYYKTFQGSCTAVKFSEFLIELDSTMVDEHGIRNSRIIMDNARPHTAVSTAMVMSTLVNSTKFLSSYSFMLNPIEFAFSKIKSILRGILIT